MAVAAKELSSFLTEHPYVLHAGPHHDLMSYCAFLREEELDMDAEDSAQLLKLLPLSERILLARTQSERVAAAREFLLVREDCGLPYFILAREGSVDESEAAAHYLKALELSQGEYNLDYGEAKHSGETWSGINPYFIEEEAHCIITTEVSRFLWQLGKREEALEIILAAADIFNDCCEERPVYTAISWLIQLGRDQEARLLVDNAPSADAEWLYTKALLLFRSFGNSPLSRAALQYAVMENRLIGKMLLSSSSDDLKSSNEAHDQYDQEEVQKFVDDTRSAWHESSGAQEWLTKFVTGEAWKSILDDEEHTSKDAARLKRWRSNFDLAKKFIARGDAREAKRSIKMAVKEGEQLGLGSWQLRKSLTMMIELLRQTAGSTEEVVEILERQAAYFETTCGADCRALAMMLQTTAYEFAQLGMYERACDLLRKIMRLMEKLLEEGDQVLSLFSISRVAYNLASCLAAQRQYAEAEPLLRRSLSLEEEFLGKNHPHLIPVLEKLEHYLHHLNRCEEEAEIRERLNELEGDCDRGCDTDCE